MSVEGTNYRDDRGNPSKSFEKGDKPSPSILSPSVETNGATTLLYSFEYQPKFKNQSNLRTITNCYSQRFKRESSISTTRSQPKYHANNVSSKNRREYLNNICKKKREGKGVRRSLISKRGKRNWWDTEIHHPSLPLPLYLIVQTVTNDGWDPTCVAHEIFRAYVCFVHTPSRYE